VFLAMDVTAMSAPGDPLDTPPPAFLAQEASALAERLFGVAGRATPLDSERDQNFRIATAERMCVLKISNVADDRLTVEMQTEAMLHIARVDPSLPVMQPLPARAGGYIATVEGADEGTYLVRLFTFLPGRTAAPAELDAVALGGFGATVARMGLALRGFFHPAGGYKILWDLRHTPELRAMLTAIDDPARHAIVARILDRFEQRVAPSFPRLRAQLIHNDLTLDNVLLDDRGRVSGIVDFGDLTHTALVCDLAIALVSVMWGRPEPLEAGEQAVSGYRSVATIEEAEAELLGDLVSARLAALVAIAHSRVRRYPDNAAYIMGNVDLAWDLLEHFDSLGAPEVTRRLRAACMQPRARRPRPHAAELLARRRRALGPALAPLSYDEPLYLVRGQGSRMFDHAGRPYLDAYNNVPIVGHSHPHVASAIAEQSAILNTNTRYLHDSVVELAERLVATMPEGLDTVMFVNSGSEANDVAWRLATAYTGGVGAIVTEHAYHGVTTATIALSPEGWAASERPPHVETIPAPDGYRGPWRDHRAAARYAGCALRAAASLERRGVRAAAFFVDSLFTSDGIFTPPPAYLRDVVGALRETGCLVVADEVQAGYGRTGSHLWSFAAAGITPDLVTLGKPMGNGHPVAALVCRRDIAERFAARTDLFSTFGGNPVACRAGLAVLEVLERERLRERAGEVGCSLRADLAALMERHDAIGDVRGAGLMLGVELVADRASRAPDPALTSRVVNGMKDRGVLVGSTGPADNVLKIRPPLVLSPEEADVIATTLDATLRELRAE
jgi:4-aminobutyrate aminotransferase-like enzyme/Ser/Thr protein kinase RdoA (MazF antagonist)